VPIIRSWRLRDVIASCWYVPWLQEGCQDRLAGSASMDGFVRSRQLLMMGTWLPETCWATSRRELKLTKVTSSWFFLSTLNYVAQSTTHQVHTRYVWIYERKVCKPKHVCHLVLLLQILSRILRDLSNVRVGKQIFFSPETFYLPS